MSDNNECRICKESDSRSPLLSPCQCSGSLKFVHKSCLLTWIQTSHSNRCGVCRSDYNCNIVVRRMSLWRFLRLKWTHLLLFLVTMAIFSVVMGLAMEMRVMFAIPTHLSSFERDISGEDRVFSSWNKSCVIDRHLNSWWDPIGESIAYNDVIKKIILHSIVLIPVSMLGLMFVQDFISQWNRFYEYDLN